MGVSKMKAWVINNFGIDALSLEERPVPSLGEKDVLVKLHASSINYRDLMVVEGTYNPKMKLPAVPFSDGAGEVVESEAPLRNGSPAIA